MEKQDTFIFEPSSLLKFSIGAAGKVRKLLFTATSGQSVHRAEIFQASSQWPVARTAGVLFVLALVVCFTHLAAASFLLQSSDTAIEPMHKSNGVANCLLQEHIFCSLP